MKIITFYNELRGYHQVLIDNIPSQYEIYNASIGLSGSGNNAYFIYNKITDKITVIGSLRQSKKTVKNWINKQS